MKNEIEVNEIFKFTAIKVGCDIRLSFISPYDEIFNTVISKYDFERFSKQIQELVKIFESIDKIDSLSRINTI